jgi:N,N'-diacetyllegionaminate synthase
MKNHVFIIAEAGINHNGDMNLAYKLINVAANAKVDAIKFQTFNTDEELIKDTDKTKYQKKHTDSNESLYEMTKKLELNSKNHDELISYCKDKSILFLSSASDIPSLELLVEKNQKIWKIPSNLINDYPYLLKVGKMNQKVILSSGMSTLNEIESAIDLLVSSGTNKENITILQCNTEYPTPFEDVNLKAMLTIRDKLDVKVGYSDHTEGIEVSIAAVSMGAKVIEKHFTLDKSMIGPDHKASLEPNELISMVKAIRNIEKAFGSKEKTPSKSELKNKTITRKCIVSSVKIKKGDFFTESNITTKRPAIGINPMRWNEVIGQKALRDFNKNEPIEI